MDSAPVFIVGFARSGTTLLATMLDRHSAIAVTPETHFFDQFYASTKRGFWSKEEGVIALLTNPRILDLGVGRDAILKEFEVFDCDHAGLLTATLEAYRRKCGKSFVIEKTPAHLPYIPIIFDWFPGARIIYIERDGRDAVMSLMRMPWSHRNLRRHARMWRWCVGRAETLERRYSGQWHTVNYESLVRQPERELERVCTFLGVEREADQLDRSVPTEVVPKWEDVWKGGAANDRVHPGKIQDWRASSTTPQLLIMNSMMGPPLRARGYPDTRTSNFNLVKRAANAIQNAWYLVAYHPRVRPTLVYVRRALRPLIGNWSKDTTEVVGEDVCEQWHREHGTRSKIGA